MLAQSRGPNLGLNFRLIMVQVEISNMEFESRYTLIYKAVIQYEIRWVTFFIDL